jgi:hypothetical protein
MEERFSKDTRWGTVVSFWLTVGEALLRPVAVLLFALLHWGITWAVKASLGPDLHQLEDILASVSAIAFAAVNAYLLFDMIAVFMPQLRKKRR